MNRPPGLPGDLGHQGSIYQATVGREAALACFEERQESEIVIDPRMLSPLRAAHWTKAEMDQMAERVSERIQAHRAEALGKAAV